ncbi:MAG: hypothetical protein RBT55_14785 [Rhodocyclaceae bacterium]|nr:hypothetical protein [Rhodocyclaceae bacterium]
MSQHQHPLFMFRLLLRAIFIVLVLMAIFRSDSIHGVVLSIAVAVAGLIVDRMCHLYIAMDIRTRERAERMARLKAREEAEEARRQAEMAAMQEAERRARREALEAENAAARKVIEEARRTAPAAR